MLLKATIAPHLGAGLCPATIVQDLCAELYPAITPHKGVDLELYSAKTQKCGTYYVQQQLYCPTPRNRTMPSYNCTLRTSVRCWYLLGGSMTHNFKEAWIGTKTSRALARMKKCFQIQNQKKIGCFI